MVLRTSMVRLIVLRVLGCEIVDRDGCGEEPPAIKPSPKTQTPSKCLAGVILGKV